jgi:hypothetical protein
MTEAPACVPVSWLRLEQYALGELGAGARAEIADHLAGCARCRACADRIAADHRELPPLPERASSMGAAALPPLPRRGGLRAGWRPAFTAAAVAAVVAAVLVRPHERPPVVDVGDAAGPRVVAVKGGDVTVELVRERDGSTALEPSSFAPGDRFQVLLTCPPPLQLHADLAVLQDGDAAFPGAPSTIACGNRVAVPPAFRITGAGAATICVAVDPAKPPSRAALASGDSPAVGSRACLRLERGE